MQQTIHILNAEKYLNWLLYFQRFFFDIHAVIEILNDVCYNKLKGGEAAFDR